MRRGNDRSKDARDADRPWRNLSHRTDRPQPRRGRRYPGYGAQAHRQGTSGPYAFAFALIVAALVAFLFFGVRWVSGNGRQGAIGATPTASIPAPAVVPVVQASLAPSASATPSPSPVERQYVVRAGDTPAAIAKQFGITAQELMQANGITDPGSLQVGQILQLPGR